jgi:hypothetical protein
VLSIIMARGTIGKVGVGAVVHVVFLAVGLLKTVGWATRLQLVDIEGFVGIRYRGPIRVDVQAISKEPARWIRIQERKAHYLNVLSVNPYVLREPIGSDVVSNDIK